MIKERWYRISIKIIMIILFRRLTQSTVIIESPVKKETIITIREEMNG